MTMFLFNNIGTACHQLFLSRLANKEHKDDDDKEEMSSKNFRPSSINCFWLIAPLVSAMPSPPPPITQMSSQNSHWCSWTTSAMKAHFLKVVSENLKTMPDAKNKSQESSEHSKYEQLLAYQPFLNLVMTCTEGENVKQLLDTLLDYIDDIVNRVRKNPIIPHQSNFMPEREGLVLRLNLLTGLFDHLATNANAESWASVLYQLLLFEVFTNEDTDYFDTCLDMLIILCHKMYPQRTYATFAGKFKNYRVPDDLYCLQQLLPIPKSQAELTAWDTFSNSIRTTAPQTNVGGKGSSVEQNQNLQMAKPQVMPMAKPQIQGIVVDKQFESIEKKILRMLKHDHWIQRNTDSNGKISLSFILRSGLPGEDKIRPDPFLSPPEMEQVSIIQEIGEEQSEKILQEMDKQQKYQQTLAPQRQQQSIIEQQNHQMRTYQQQMLQQQMMAAGGGHPIAGLGEPTSSSSGHAGQMPPSFSNQSPFLNLIQQQTGATHGSGSSTPVTTDSPARTGAGRGGRRKSQAGSNQAAVGTVAGAGTGRGQKRRKETTKHQTPQMMGGNGGMEMFSINPQGGNGLPGTTTGIMGGAGPGGQMAMSHTPMMMQQQMQAQIWQQQQMQRQGPAPQQPMGMGGPMMYNQQQPSAQQASQQFRQQPPPQYQPPQQQAPGPSRPNVQYGGNQMPQMPMGMVGPGQVMQGIGTQPPPQMSDVKKQINAKLMQKQQHKQAQQQQQQQHPGMGGMGMPPGP